MDKGGSTGAVEHVGLTLALCAELESIQISDHIIVRLTRLWCEISDLSRKCVQTKSTENAATDDMKALHDDYSEHNNNYSSELYNLPGILLTCIDAMEKLSFHRMQLSSGDATHEVESTHVGRLECGENNDLSGRRRLEEL